MSVAQRLHHGSPRYTRLAGTAFVSAQFALGVWAADPRSNPLDGVVGYRLGWMYRSLMISDIASGELRCGVVESCCST